jgi:hypothetical protein
MLNPIPFQRQNNVDWFQQLQINSYNASTNIRTPFDLSGCELKMTLIGENSSMPSLTLSTTDGLLVIPSSGDLGEAIIDVPAVTMWTLEGGYYNADMIIFTPSGAVVPAFTAEILIIAGDTAPTP